MPQINLVIKDRFFQVQKTITFEHDAIERYIVIRTPTGSEHRVIDPLDQTIDFVIPTLSAMTISPGQ